jgi:hypothetical protein
MQTAAAVAESRSWKLLIARRAPAGRHPRHEALPFRPRPTGAGLDEGAARRAYARDRGVRDRQLRLPPAAAVPSAAPLCRDDLSAHPMEQFHIWFTQACTSGLAEPNAMALATVKFLKAWLIPGCLTSAGPLYRQT